MKKYLVIDAGGTAVKYALMNESAKILERGKFPTPGYVDHTLEDFLQRLDVVVEKYQKQIEGIAVSMPGMLDSRKRLLCDRRNVGIFLVKFRSCNYWNKDINFR